MFFLADFRTNDSEMSFSYKVYWALNTTGIVLALGITVGYWFTVYDPGKYIEKGGVEE
jgi:tRNA splicing endonuclease